MLRNNKLKRMRTANLMGTGSTKTVVELSMNDLREVVGDVLREERAKAAEEAKKAQTVDIYTRKEVAELLNVSFATLNRWEKIGYLKPVRAGRKVHYLKSDIQNLISK